MEPLKVIPRPLPERLRDVRTKLLPTLVFLCTVVLVASIWRAHFIPAQVSAEADIIVQEEPGTAAMGEEEHRQMSDKDELVSMNSPGGGINDGTYGPEERISRN